MKLKEITIKLDKSKIKAGDGKSFGSYPLFTCSPVLNKYCDDYLYDTDAIIIGTGGNPVINYFNGKFNVSTDCLTLKVKDNYICKYIYYLLLANINKIQDMFRGAGIKHLNKNEFLDLEIIDLSKKEQKLIVSKLDIIQEIIKNKQQQLRELEEVVKSQFVEMFGDINCNDKKLNIKKLKECCLKITDGTHDTPKKYETGKMLITGKNIRENKFDLTNIEYVSEEDHKKIYARCNPEKGDVLYTNIGVNYCTAMVNSLDFEFSMKNVALLKPNYNCIESIYLSYALNILREKITGINKCAGAQTFIGLSSISEIDVPVPKLELQNKFAEFVKLIDKQKFEIQKSLDEIKNLQKSLMNKYFGG